MQTKTIGEMMDDMQIGADGLPGGTLVPCHVDISCLYAEATNPLGLSALVDLSDVGPVPGCAAMPAIYFPRASAEKIVEKSNDPMIGDDALSWDGDAIVDEYDGAVDPISIEGIAYWRVGWDYLWEATEGPDGLFELLPDGRVGIDLDALADGACAATSMARLRRDARHLLSTGLRREDRREVQRPDDRR